MEVAIPGLLNGTLGPPRWTHSALGITQALGQSLIAQIGTGEVVLHVKTDTVVEDLTTRNVIAETPGGDPENVVVIGAHLGSVSRGPGINDNGSGSGTILEVAEVFAAQDRLPRNKLRFIWFGAEELGLLGSNHYVDNVTADERADIMAMLNFDMVGYPNYARFVYVGDGSATSPAGPPAPGSSKTCSSTTSTARAWRPNRLSSPDVQTTGGSSSMDPPPVACSPAPRSPRPPPRSPSGGTAGVPYDPCYHLACDTFAGTGSGAGATSPGLGLKALDEMSDALAHAVLFMSRTKVDITATASAALRTSRAPALPDFHDHDPVSE